MADPQAETATWAGLAADPGLPDVEILATQVVLRHVQEGTLYFVLEATESMGWSGQPAQQAHPGTGEAKAAGRAAAVLSEPLLLQELAGNLALLRRAVRQAPAGRLSAVSASYDARAKGWVGLLTSYNRADLLATVTSYLRHRGRWEDTARDLGLHRNSLRHRISIAQTRLGVSLDDPDVAAHLWLALQDADTA